MVRRAGYLRRFAAASGFNRAITPSEELKLTFRYSWGVASTTPVTLRRDSESDIKIRDLYATLDSGNEINLLYGESKTLDLTPGEHTLTVTNRFKTKRLSFELKEGEPITIPIGNVLMGCWSISFIIVGMGPYGVKIWPPEATT
jgi:hypothetical protein